MNQTKQLNKQHSTLPKKRERKEKKNQDLLYIQIAYINDTHGRISETVCLLGSSHYYMDASQLVYFRFKN